MLLLLLLSYLQEGLRVWATGRAMNLLGGLKAGDVVIQNGGDTALAQAVVQVAKQQGLQTITVLPYTNEFKAASNALRGGGADVVVADPYVQTSQFQGIVAEMGAPVLAINQEGGSSGANICRPLADGGVCVSTGPDAEASMTIPGEKNITHKAFEEGGAFDVAKAMGLWGDSAPAHVWMETYALSEFQQAVSKAAEEPRSYRTAVLLTGN